MTTVPERGFLRGFRGFNLNARPDVLPARSSRDFTAAIEALDRHIQQDNALIDATYNTLLTHITNYNNPHKLDFKVFYGALRKEIYSRYVELFDKSAEENPLSEDDFFTAVRSNPLMLFELIRLLVVNGDLSEHNPSNGIDVTSHGRISPLSEPIYSYNRALPGSNDYPYYNGIQFVITDAVLPSGFIETLRALSSLKGTLTQIAPPLPNVIAEDVQNESRRTVANLIKTANQRQAVGRFSDLGKWGSTFTKLFMDAEMGDSPVFEQETLFFSFRVSESDLEQIGSSNSFPYVLHMFPTGEGLLITVTYSDGKRYLLIRQIAQINDILYIADTEPLLMETVNYALAMLIDGTSLTFVTMKGDGGSRLLYSATVQKQFADLADPTGQNRFILTNIRLKRDDTYIYDYLNTDSKTGFTDSQQKQTVFMNHLEVHRGRLPDDYIQDRLSSTL